MRPRLEISSLENGGAQGKPGTRCTRGLACMLRKQKRTQAYRSSGGTPTFPAQWLYGLYEIVLVTGFLATIPVRGSCLVTS